VNLFEFEGKALLRRAAIAVPRGIFCADVAAALTAGETTGYPCVLKSQVLTGGRGRAGGIAIVDAPEELRREAKRILALEIKGERPAGLLVEERLANEGELYAAVTFDGSLACPVLLCSPVGGIDVEANAQSLFRIPVPVEQLEHATPAWIAERLAPLLANRASSGGEGTAGADLTPAEVAAVSALLADLLHAFSDFDLELMEINPLVRTPDGLVAADAKITVDDDALFRQESLTLVDRPPLGRLEARAKEHGLTFIDLEGEVCVMGNGAGLCLSLLDAIAAFGSSAANFLDTGGGASTTKAYEGMRILQDRGLHDPAVRARLVMLSLAITRAGEAAEGIARAEAERPDDPVPTFAVVHGTGADEGRRILEEAGIRVAPDIRTGVELAATARRRS
jgi:succinyl-CoA synthetase beta subunit